MIDNSIYRPTAADATPEKIGELRRLERMRGMPDRDIVTAWYRAKDADTWVLTDKQTEIRQRVDFAKAQFLARHNYADTIEALVTQFEISSATARRDIEQSMLVFGSLAEVPKQAHRARAVEMALATFRMAEVKEDATGMAKATVAYIQATGIDKDDPDGIDVEKIMRERTYIEVLDPALRELLLNFLTHSGGSVDVSTLFERLYAAKEGEYVEYESATDNT